MGKFFMPSFKIHADENKLGVFLIDFLISGILNHALCNTCSLILPDIWDKNN